MTEEEWPESTDPGSMLQFLRKKVSDRKLRLFAVAGVQRIAFNDERIAEIVKTSESYADGKVEWNELSNARKMAKAIVEEAMQRRGRIGYGAGAVQWVEAMAHPSAWTAAERVASLRYADLVREIFGNPFRPVTFNPTWLTLKDVALAQQIYDARAFDQLPILTDALEEAGCDIPDILAHCRGPGQHVRGCWVVDLVLGKR